MRITNKAAAGVLMMCIGVLPYTCAGVPKDQPALTVDRLFDRYGRIGWEAEEAHLDNFVLQLQNDPDFIGYIFVYDANDMCEGEAQARAIRAKRYLVERRGVPWNRVIWRNDGYGEEFSMILQPVSRSTPIPYPFVESLASSPKRHVTKHCRARMAEIRNPNT